MKEFSKQPFYNKLSKNFIKDVENLISKKSIASTCKVFELIFYLIVSFIIFYNILLKNNITSSNAEFISSAFQICTACLIIIISNIIFEIPKKNFDKAKTKVKNGMLFDICECTQHCTCRNEFRKYLEDINIDLFKDDITEKKGT